MKYLITNPDSFGDILLRQPLFSGLLDAGHEVGVFVRQSYSSIVRFLDPRIRIYTMDDINPYVPSIIERKADVIRALDHAAEFNPDALIVAPFQRTMIDIWAIERFAGKPLIGLKGIEVVYEEGVRIFRETTRPGDRIVHVPEDLREIEKNRRLLSLCLGREGRDYEPTLTLDDTSLELARGVLKRIGVPENEYVVCTPGSTSVAVKQYPEGRFVEILGFWSERYRRPILLIGNRIEAEVLQSINERLRAQGIGSAIWIGDESSLEILLGLISLARMYFGNDTGPMHFAAALRKPVIALFGGGTWPRFIPAATRGAAILQELPCYGCGWRCVFDKAHCIHSVEVGWVKQAIDDLETKKTKKFKVYSHEFEGEMMDRWIAEAREQLRNNKTKIDSMSFELEKAREIARNRETAAAEGRVELEAMRTEYLNQKKREEEARAEAASLREDLAALRAEVSDLRKANVLVAESVKAAQDSLRHEQEGRKSVEARLADVIQQLESERDVNRRLRENEDVLVQKVAGIEKTLDATKGVVAEMEKVIASNEAAITLGRTTIGELESAIERERRKISGLEARLVAEQAGHAMAKETISRLGGELSKERAIVTAHSRTIEGLESTLGSAKRIGSEMKRVLTDFKPRLEELHLSIRLQDVTLQKFEQRLQGVAQSGWTKLGLTLHIPWLSKWYAEAFSGKSENGVPMVRKDEFEVPLSVKENMRLELNRILGMMDSFPV